jgi:serine/threonine-protein kinase
MSSNGAGNSESAKDAIREKSFQLFADAARRYLRSRIGLPPTIRASDFLLSAAQAFASDCEEQGYETDDVENLGGLFFTIVFHKLSERLARVEANLLAAAGQRPADADVASGGNPAAGTEPLADSEQRLIAEGWRQRMDLVADLKRRIQSELANDPETASEATAILDLHLERFSNRNIAEKVGRSQFLIGEIIDACRAWSRDAWPEPMRAFDQAVESAKQVRTDRLALHSRPSSKVDMGAPPPSRPSQLFRADPAHGRPSRTDITIVRLVARFERAWQEWSNVQGEQPSIELFLDTVPEGERYEAFASLAISDLIMRITRGGDATARASDYLDEKSAFGLRLANDRERLIPLIVAEYRTRRRLGAVAVRDLLHGFEDRPFYPDLKLALPEPYLVPCPCRDCDGQIEILDSARRIPLTCPKCHKALEWLGNYLLDPDRIGEGGSGEVFRATQIHSKRIVALKRLKPDLENPDAALERFQREARFAGSLEPYSGLVRPILPEQDSGVHFIAYDLVDGESLRKYVEERASAVVDGVIRQPSAPARSLPPRKAARIAAAVARTLGYVHRKGIFHRDVKPDNILMDSDGQPHLTDFGVATDLKSRDRDAQLGGGTPKYMAPEQLDPKLARITAATDVYSLGVVLYELLTGRHPWDDNDTASAIDRRELARRVLEETPISPRQINRRVPRPLARVCLKALRYNPDERYATGAVFAGAIDQAALGPLPRPVVVLPAVVALAAGLASWYLLVRPFPTDPQPFPGVADVKFYNTFVRKSGVPVGIGPILPPLRGRERTVAIVRRKESVRVALVNAEGRPMTHEAIGSLLPTSASYLAGADPNRESRWMVKFDSDNDVPWEDAFDDRDRKIFRLEYWPDEAMNQLIGRFRDSTLDNQVRATSGADHVLITRSATGYDQKVLYMAGKQNPMPDDRGCFGELRELRSDGLPTKITLVDSDGRTPRTCRFGYAMIEYHFDEAGRCLLERYLNLRGEEVVTPDRYSKIIREYDRVNGNLVSEKYFAPDGHWIAHRDGYVGRRFGYDEGGRIVSTEFVDQDGRPCVNRASGGGYASVRFAYPDSMTTVITYHDVGGQLARNKEGYAVLKIVAPSNGGDLKMAFENEKMEPTSSVVLGYPMLGANKVERGNPIRWIRIASDRDRMDASAGFTGTLDPQRFSVTSRADQATVNRSDGDRLRSGLAASTPVAAAQGFSLGAPAGGAELQQSRLPFRSRTSTPEQTGEGPVERLAPSSCRPD